MVRYTAGAEVFLEAERMLARKSEFVKQHGEERTERAETAFC